MIPKPVAFACVLAAAAALAAARPAVSRADGMVNPEPQAAEETGQGAGAPASGVAAGGDAGGTAGAQGPSLSAKVVPPTGAKDAARVEVSVKGVESPRLQYKVDDNPSFETSDTKVSFRGLSSGSHRISVLLEGRDGAPLGPSETLDVTVP